jgi:hypothetical protein
LINNVLYVIILSAALDLVPSATPKGVIAFFNIFPALLAKVGWPYIFKGQIRYYLRVFSCATCSFLGMMVRLPCISRSRLLSSRSSISLPLPVQIIAFFPYLPLRLLGISLLVLSFLICLPPEPFCSIFPVDLSTDSLPSRLFIEPPSPLASASSPSSSSRHPTIPPNPSEASLAGPVLLVSLAQVFGSSSKASAFESGSV